MNKNKLSDEVREVIESVIEDYARSEDEFTRLNTVIKDREKTIFEKDSKISELRTKISSLEKQKPTDFELKQYEEAKKALKDVESIRRDAYNKGYADAYTDTTSRMFPQQQIQLPPTNNVNY